MALRSLPAITAGLIVSGAIAPVAADARAAAAQCTRGWAGSVNYSRRQATSDNKTVERVSRKGTDTIGTSMTYDYVAQIAVRPAPGEDYSTGLANISMNSIATETVSAQDQDRCRHETGVRQVSGQFTSKTETRANESGLQTDVNVSLDNDGTYGVSVSLPEIKGTVSGSESSSFSGQCKAKDGRNQSIDDMPATIDGVKFSTDGEDRLDPKNPDRLSGSHSATYYGVTETLSWNLRRCGPSLRLVDVKFEDMRFPVWEDWQEISEQKGTVDGNLVRLKAVVANDGPEERAVTVKFRDTYKGDKWDGAKPDGLIGQVSVTVPAGEQREVTYQWDSSGYSWYDDGRPRLVQRIKAEAVDAGKTIDDMTRNLKVAPKPLLLVHGLWSNWRTWDGWQNLLTATHSYDWKAFPVGEKPENGRMNTGEEVGHTGPTYSIDQNAEQLGNYIEYAQKDRNAWHVDIVAHSMGGLISRRYIHASMPSFADGKPQVSRLIMLGTPNMGSRCADLMSWPLEQAGRSMEALRELRPSVVARFNAVHTERKGVEFSVLAGNPMWPVCYMLDANDGVVAVPSAIWTISDNEQQGVLHTNMTTTEVFASFVKPRLVRGPGRQQAPSGGSGSAPGPAARLMLLGTEDPADTGEAKPDFAKIVKLRPGEAMDVTVPVRDATKFGVTFVAASTVSATLVDEAGTVAGTNRTGTPDAAQTFRSLFVDRAISAGKWTLSLKNDDEVEREVIISTWSVAP